MAKLISNNSDKNIGKQMYLGCTMMEPCRRVSSPEELILEEDFRRRTYDQLVDDCLTKIVDNFQLIDVQTTVWDYNNRQAFLQFVFDEKLFTDGTFSVDDDIFIEEAVKRFIGFDENSKFIGENKLIVLKDGDIPGVKMLHHFTINIPKEVDIDKYMSSLNFRKNEFVEKSFENISKAYQ